jgi:hypothetical protein
MRIFKKAAVAAAVAAGAAAVSLPAHAVIEATPAEAFLVPVVYAGILGTPPGPTMFINTYIAVETPQVIGQDAIPNTFTAPNTTPSNTNCTPSCNAQWYFFDVNSVHRADGPLHFTANDVEVIPWYELITGQGRQDLLGVAGYMVIGNANARIAGGAGDPNDPVDANADFAMYAETQLVITDYYENTYAVQIPTLGMVDSDDGVSVINGSARPEEADMDDGVKYTVVGNVPSSVSPLISGMRIANGDGVPDQIVRMKINLGNRNTQDTLIAVWLDRNNPEYSYMSSNVFDDDENYCSSPMFLPRELNLVWVEDRYEGGINAVHLGGNLHSGADDILFGMCDPTPDNYSDSFGTGWVEIILQETAEQDFVSNAVRGTPTSSGVGLFTILNGDAIDYVNGALVPYTGYIDYIATDNASELGRFGFQ